ncbi:MAG: TetR/AcrR family transcriptional regulator [Lachnospiraceae bacterium]|nr:TetR/AcrR family transcriptional regulator [Lachnospiraceae bacterium]
MPPKAKFTRETIIDTAFIITQEQGIDAVTARELGKCLGSSARPIFTVFASMEEVKELVILRAKELYQQYVEEGLKNELPFKGIGLAYIRFASEQPKLFQLLFMSTFHDKPDLSSILPVLDDHYDRTVWSVQEPFHLEKEPAQRLYQHLWIYTHGIATMIVTGLCSYSMEQIEENMTEIVTGLLLLEERKKGA